MPFALLLAACASDRSAVDDDDRTVTLPPDPFLPAFTDGSDTATLDIEPSPSAWGSCVSLRSLLVVGGPGHQFLESVAIAPDGSRFVAANSSAPLTLGAGSPSEVTLTPLEYTVGVVARFDAADSLLWAVPFDGPGEGVGRSLALQPDGGVVVGHGGGGDAWLVKFDAAGGVAWTRGFGGPGLDLPGFLFAVPDGGFVVAGRALEDMTFGFGEPAETTLVMPPGAWVAGYVARYTADGNLVWAQPYGGAYLVEPAGVQYDAAVDAVTVVGTLTGSGVAVWGTGTDAVAVDPAGDEVFVARYAGDGTFQWVETAGGTTTRGRGITAAAGGEVVATGYFRGTATFGFGEDRETALTTEGISMWTARHTADGELGWVTSSFSGTATSLGKAVAPTGDHFLVTTGFDRVLVLGRGTDSEMVFRTSDPPSEETVLALYGPDGAFVCGVQVESVRSSTVPYQYQDVYGIAERPDGGLDIYGIATGVVRFGAGTPAEVEIVADGSEAFVATVDLVAP